MAPREGTLVYDQREGCYVLHGCPLREGDPLDILAGTTWIAGHVGYEPSDECIIFLHQDRRAYSTS